MASFVEPCDSSLPNDSVMSSNIKAVLDSISTASRIKGTPVPRLVAVSKTKPPGMIKVAYEQGLRHFGENYVQELIDKANHPLLVDLDINWHFIGRLQRNKTNILINRVPKLHMIETITSDKIATAIDTSLKKSDPLRKLPVMIQVNTSGEDSKQGCPPGGVQELTRFLIENCSSLDPVGLMTIGSMSHDYTTGPNPDFKLLKSLREDFTKESGKEWVELSMGMSADYMEAIRAGSTSVRVGSAIFGTREVKQ